MLYVKNLIIDLTICFNITPIDQRIYLIVDHNFTEQFRDLLARGDSFAWKRADI